MTATAALPRRLFAEFVGTGLLVTIVVGSGIAAQSLTTDPGGRLLENALATAAGLAVLIAVLGPVSGAHFNPVVSVADWWLNRRSRHGLGGAEVPAYAVAQVAGAVAGAVLANVMFGEPAVKWSTHVRSAGHLRVAEVVATAGLLLVIVTLVRSGRTTSVAWAVGAYIGAAYFFTSSTSFANPAVTTGRAFTDTFAGIAPRSVPGFVVAQVIGAAIGVAVAVALVPASNVAAPELVVPHESFAEQGS
jgi:glycerol uptake facilitator-like aquaporin